MRIPTEIIQSLNEQLNRELYAEYFYMAIAGYFFEKELRGFAHFFLRQSQEEKEHAMRLFNYLVEKGVPFTPLPIEAPSKNYASPLGCFEAAYEYEQRVTLTYYNLLKKVREMGEYDVEEFLWWYIREQREEESLMQSWVDQLKLAGEDAAAILLLDQKAGKGEKD
ncbi:MAG: ferritin [Bacteroidia bacterium]|nr:ferritin [Bacteroidia bacterium]MDW8133937.1 ferritin [Bacteroidia bacterium]